MATSIDFPASPIVNDTYTYGSVTYTWNGVTWAVEGNVLISDLSDELSGIVDDFSGLTPEIDFQANIQYNILPASSGTITPTFINPVAGKSVVITIPSGGPGATATLSLPANFYGDIAVFDPTKTSQLTIYCYEDGPYPKYTFTILNW